MPSVRQIRPGQVQSAGQPAVQQIHSGFGGVEGEAPEPGVEVAVDGFVTEFLARAVERLPEDLYQIERATWSGRRISPLRSRDLEDGDSRYELTAGSVEGYLQDKDGLRNLRKWRVPSTSFEPYVFDADSDDGFGILRDLDGIVDGLAPPDEVGDIVGVDGVEVFSDFGILGPIFSDTLAVRLEYRRRGEPLCCEPAGFAPNFVVADTVVPEVEPEPPSGGLVIIDDYLDMITRPQQSVSTEARAFKSTLMVFDPDDYDNVEFRIQVYAGNASLTTEYDIIIEDSVTLAEVYRIPVPASTADNTLIEANGGEPIVGLPAGTYRVRLEKTASNNQLRAFSVRIYFHQENPTKTRLQKRMLVGGAISNTDLVLGENRFSIGGDSGYLLEDSSDTLTKVEGAWDFAAEWTLEAILGGTAILGTCNTYAALWNTTTDTEVAEVLSTATHSFTQLLEADFADDAANFTVGDTFRIYSREEHFGSFGGSNSLILGVRLYVRITGIVAATTPL